MAIMAWAASICRSGLRRRNSVNTLIGTCRSRRSPFGPLDQVALILREGPGGQSRPVSIERLLRPDRGDLGSHALGREVESDVLTDVEAVEQCRRSGLEGHGHGGPAHRRDWPVLDGDLGSLGINRGDDTDAMAGLRGMGRMIHAGHAFQISARRLREGRTGAEDGSSNQCSV